MKNSPTFWTLICWKWKIKFVYLFTIAFCLCLFSIRIICICSPPHCSSKPPGLVQKSPRVSRNGKTGEIPMKYYTYIVCKIRMNNTQKVACTDDGLHGTPVKFYACNTKENWPHPTFVFLSACTWLTLAIFASSNSCKYCSIHILQLNFE